MEQSTWIDVEASVEQVWVVLREVERWPEWAARLPAAVVRRPGATEALLPLAIGQGSPDDGGRGLLTVAADGENGSAAACPSIEGRRLRRASAGRRTDCARFGQNSRDGAGIGPARL